MSTSSYKVYFSDLISICSHDPLAPYLISKFTMIIIVVYFVINGVALQIILDANQILLLLFENTNEEMEFKAGQRVTLIKKVSEIVNHNTNFLISSVLLLCAMWNLSSCTRILSRVHLTNNRLIIIYFVKNIMIS